MKFKEKLLFIGDLAGRLTLLEKIEAKFKDHQKILLGDLQDRGSYSKQSIDFIRSNNNYFPIFGNHEEMFIGFYLYEKFNPYKWIDFLQHGGIPTLISYQTESSLINHLKSQEKDIVNMMVEYIKFPNHHKFHQDNKEWFNNLEKLMKEAKKAISQDTIDYLNSLPLYYTTKQWIASHAPLNQKLSDEYSESEMFYWSRKASVFQGKDLYHGHLGTYHKKYIKKELHLCLDNSKKTPDQLYFYDLLNKKVYSVNEDNDQVNLIEDLNEKK